jgi:Holliday junction DNA helicase RuvA
LISRLKGRLLTREADGTVEVETDGGVVYEVDVPLSVLQRLPTTGASVELRTLQIVKEDSITLFGFLDRKERELFRRLMGAHGVGARLAFQMLSAYAAPRLARAIAEKDVTALKQVSGVGKKTAEMIVLTLSDKVADLAIGEAEVGAESPGLAQEAVAALVALGFAFADADKAVRGVLEDGGADSSETLIRKALARPR